MSITWVLRRTAAVILKGCTHEGKKGGVGLEQGNCLLVNLRKSTERLFEQLRAPEHALLIKSRLSFSSPTRSSLKPRFVHYQDDLVERCHDHCTLSK